MYTIQLSVRSLVESLYLGGDLVSSSQSTQRANLGSQIHRMLQSQQKQTYAAEVYLKITTELDDFCFTIDGRADGIITTEEGVIIDKKHAACLTKF